MLKPAQEAPLTTLHLASCLEEAGIPAGVLNVVVGRGGAVGGPLVAHPAVQAISFTGSVAVGERLRTDAAAAGKRVQLELGGQNPFIVMADADLERAVEACYAGAYWSAGQKCTSTRRIYVQDAVHDAFREQLLERMARGVVGDPLDPATEVGPLVNESQVEEVLAGDRPRPRARAARCWRAASGAARASSSSRRCSRASPTTRSSRARRCSGRSPRSTASPTSTRRSRGRTPCASASRRRSSRATPRPSTRSCAASRRRLIHVNQQTAGADFHVPFGGVKGSGYGPHEQGRAAIEFYTEVVTVYADV